MTSPSQPFVAEHVEPGSLPLANPQWEAYAHAVASGESLTEAAKIANYVHSSAHNTGSRLVKQHPEVRDRVAYLKIENAKIPCTNRCSKDWIVTQALSMQKLARKEKNYPAHIAYLQLIARVNGFLDPDRQRTSSKLSVIDNRSVNVLTLRPNELKTVLDKHVEALPPADRQALLAAAPEIAEALSVATPVTPTESSESPED